LSLQQKIKTLRNIILITGITGFVGSNLKKYLTPYYQVLGVSINNIPESILYNQLEKSTLDEGTVLFYGEQHDSGKYFLESVEEDLRVIDAPKVCSEELYLRVE
jgi:nucleoside-diphosphate-sugar epimerase